ncbi:MAG: hypothetical protein DRR19_00145 [Candidatus Parabeggiatoa sp. nov. 1]|nr:MAG: hypothetical protein DRR19_00145 [Gammaproteobacteria bacterium]
MQWAQNLLEIFLGKCEKIRRGIAKATQKHQSNFGENIEVNFGHKVDTKANKYRVLRFFVNCKIGAVQLLFRWIPNMILAFDSGAFKTRLMTFYVCSNLCRQNNR